MQYNRHSEHPAHVMQKPSLLLTLTPTSLKERSGEPTTVQQPIRIADRGPKIAAGGTVTAANNGSRMFSCRFEGKACEKWVGATSSRLQIADRKKSPFR